MVTLLSCQPADTIAGNVIKTARRGDGAAVAIVTRSSGNAITADTYYVYVQGGTPTPDVREVFSVTQSDPPRVHWEDNSKLVIDSDCGQIFSYTNLFDIIHREREASFERIFVHLNSGGLCTRGDKQ